MKFLTRPMDNSLVEELITRFRTSAGNETISRTDAARDVLKALRSNEAVGILMDQKHDPVRGCLR